MGQAAVEFQEIRFEFQEIRFDIRDQELTHCYVLCKAVGDCPLGVQGWHHKAFPASKSALDILEAVKAGDNPVLWPVQGTTSMSTGKCPCGFIVSTRSLLAEHVVAEKHTDAEWREPGFYQCMSFDEHAHEQIRYSYDAAGLFAAGGPGHGGFIGPKPMESSTAIPDPSLIAVLKEISAGIKENTTITREAWHAIVTGQQAEAPLNEGDFQQIDLCANDAEDEFIEPHIRLKKLLPVAQERHLTNKEPIAVIMGGTIYHIGLKVEDITGIVAKCR